MIVTWMFGSTLFALLLVVAAFASERALRLSRRATRTPWALALTLAVVWPAAAPIVLQKFRTPELEPMVIVAAPSPAEIVAGQLPQVTATWSDRLELVLVWAWLVLSVAMLLRLGAAVFALRRITRKSRAMRLDGADVLVTDSLGPAVVGLWKPQVAVPHWFLGLDEPLRKLVLHHEQEHCRSRDPQLVWMASLAVAVMPWNLGVWVLARRLRLALEIDCDARTLRLEESTERYGKLLLLIAQRQSSYPLVSMLAESNSHLSQRISAMQKKPLRRRAVRVALFVGVAAAAVAVACSPRIATDLTGPNPRSQNAVAAKLEAEKASGAPVYFEAKVERKAVSAPGSPGPKYPADLRAAGVEGRVDAQFVVDTNGRAMVSSLKVLRSSHPSFTAAIEEALPSMRFLSAEINGRKVKQLIQMPMVFDLANDGIPDDVAVGVPIQTGTPPNVNVLEPFTTTVVGKEATEASQAALLRAAQRAADLEQPPIRSGATPSALPANQMGIYFESQVEEPVKAAPGTVGPRYPESLKNGGKSGRVLVQFVVHEDGRVDLASFRVLQADDPLMEAAVRDALPKMIFVPAKIGGKSVKQLVQQPFTFSLSR
ncbi:MAG: TonB family protein [Phycisphaerae bacterium]|nr:TonB family protein [Gemmatimonadaceae bacterium]